MDRSYVAVIMDGPHAGKEIAVNESVPRQSISLEVAPKPAPYLSGPNDTPVYSDFQVHTYMLYGETGAGSYAYFENLPGVWGIRVERPNEMLIELELEKALKNLPKLPRGWGWVAKRMGYDRIFDKHTFRVVIDRVSQNARVE